MAIYNSLKEIENNILKERDIIVFNGIKYITVQNAILHFVDDENDKIFTILGIKDKYKFCQIHYGYEPIGNHNRLVGQFPIAINKDYHALTRVAIGLLKLC